MDLWAADFSLNNLGSDTDLENEREGRWNIKSEWMSEQSAEGHKRVCLSSQRLLNEAFLAFPYVLLYVDYYINGAWYQNIAEVSSN